MVCNSKPMFPPSVMSLCFPGLIVVAVKSNVQVKEIHKDLDNIGKRDTYVETVKLRAEVDQISGQVGALWDYTNKLRDKFNGH